MSIQRSQLILLFLCVLNGVYSSEYAPVFMWGATTGSGSHSKGNSDILSKDLFKNILMEQLDSNPFTVVFIEETLSVEDFSAKDSAGRSSYPGLREKMTGDSLIYYPYVVSSLHTLNSLVNDDKVDRIQLTEDGLSADITPGAGQFLYISLKDAREGEERMHMLSRHDRFMTEMFDKLLKKYGSVLAIYTARQPSWAVASKKHHTQDVSNHHRVARSLLAVNWTLPANPASGFYNVTNGHNVFLYSSKIRILDTEDSSYAVELSSGTASMEENTTDSVFNVLLTFSEATIKATYTIGNDGYWDVGMTLTPTGESEIVMQNKVHAAFDFSYHCSPELNFTKRNDSKVLSFQDFQTQIFLRSKENTHFNLAYDCIGFTSVPIWSGLFVAFLVIFITTIGIIMMMDIRTMDRFDDPKGKTITITTAE